MIKTFVVETKVHQHNEILFKYKKDEVLSLSLSLSLHTHTHTHTHTHKHTHSGKVIQHVPRQISLEL